MVELKGHIQEITSILENPFTLSVTHAAKAIPLLITASLDGTIRQWDIDTGLCQYILNTGYECLGMGWTVGSQFYSFSRNGVQTWDLNHFYSTYFFTK
jgi:WD40 repeat protein